MPVELELKLAVAPEDRLRLARHPLLRACAGNSPMRQQRMQALYFDTADGLLAAHGMALRLRREGAQWVQTFKTSSGTALALRTRGEWEQPVATAELDWDALAATPLAALNDFAQLRQRVQQVFAVNFDRQSWALRFDDGTRAMASLDHGEIVCGEPATRRTAPIDEFELEFESGRPSTVWKFAQALSCRVNLVPLAISKGERGSALASDAAPTPRKAETPELGPTLDAHAALALALGAPLAALQHNLRLLDFADPEFVHQARVALRRMRSVLQAFDALVRHKALKRDMARLAKPLKTLGRLLGAARDADVFVNETLGTMAAQWPQSLQQVAGITDGIDAIAADAAERQRRAHAAVRAWIATPACGRLLLAAERLVFDAAHKRAKRNEPLGTELAPLLARQHDRVQHAAAALTRQGAAERHRLRIEVKRLRYLLDIALPLWPKASSRDYRKALASLQARLGTLNDLAAAGLQLAAQHAPPALCALWAEHERKRLDAVLPKVARRLAALDLAEAPWRAAVGD